MFTKTIESPQRRLLEETLGIPPIYLSVGVEVDELADHDEGKQTSRGAHVPNIHILFSLLTHCFYLHYISLSIFSHTFISFLLLTRLNTLIEQSRQDSVLP